MDDGLKFLEDLLSCKLYDDPAKSITINDLRALIKQAKANQIKQRNLKNLIDNLGSREIKDDGSSDNCVTINE